MSSSSRVRSLLLRLLSELGETELPALVSVSATDGELCGWLQVERRPHAEPDPERASARPSDAPPAADPERLSEIEAAVLEALQAGDVLTGPAIAEASGYPYEATLRAALAAMRRRGLIENCSPGYRLSARAAG
jgi:hypothetical protein